MSDCSSGVCSSDLFKAHRLAPAVRDPDFLVLGVDARPCMAKSKAARNRLVRSMRGSASQAAIAPKSRYSKLQAICAAARAEERRVGKEGVRTFRSRWSTYHET